MINASCRVINNSNILKGFNSFLPSAGQPSWMAVMVKPRISITASQKWYSVPTNPADRLATLGTIVFIKILRRSNIQPLNDGGLIGLLLRILSGQIAFLLKESDSLIVKVLPVLRFPFFSVWA